jgi:ubiquitin-protein ligase
MEIEFYSSINNQSKRKLHQTQLRLQNDLLEIRKNRMSTKNFGLQMSDIIKDELNEIFSMNFILSSLENSFNFLILFNKEYPFSPPFLKMMSPIIPSNQKNFLGANGDLNLKFLNKEFWSPVLS